MNIKDLTGKKISSLYVKRQTEQRCGSYIVYECECECGATCYISSRKLINGQTKSCGCIRRKTAQNICAKRRQWDANVKDGTNVAIINGCLPKNNTSGHKGVFWESNQGKWRAVISFQKKRHHLGYFDDIEKAIEVRKDAELKYFGKYLKTEE